MGVEMYGARARARVEHDYKAGCSRDAKTF